jgi:hypothetical protein
VLSTFTLGWRAAVALSIVGVMLGELWATSAISLAQFASACPSFATFAGMGVETTVGSSQPVTSPVTSISSAAAASEGVGDTGSLFVSRMLMFASSVPCSWWWSEVLVRGRCSGPGVGCAVVSITGPGGVGDCGVTGWACCSWRA